MWAEHDPAVSAADRHKRRIRRRGRCAGRMHRHRRQGGVEFSPGECGREAQLCIRVGLFYFIFYFSEETPENAAIYFTTTVISPCFSTTWIRTVDESRSMNRLMRQSWMRRSLIESCGMPCGRNGRSNTTRLDLASTEIPKQPCSSMKTAPAAHACGEQATG